MIAFRPALRDDVPAVLALLADDVPGTKREGAASDRYLAAPAAMTAEGAKTLQRFAFNLNQIEGKPRHYRRSAYCVLGLIR